VNGSVFHPHHSGFRIRGSVMATCYCCGGEMTGDGCYCLACLEDAAVVAGEVERLAAESVGCPCGCGADSVAHCWNTSRWVEAIDLIDDGQGDEEFTEGKKAWLEEELTVVI
jgi:hypothetical protein